MRKFCYRVYILSITWANLWCIQVNSVVSVMAYTCLSIFYKSYGYHGWDDYRTMNVILHQYLLSHTYNTDINMLQCLHVAL